MGDTLPRMFYCPVACAQDGAKWTTFPWPQMFYPTWWIAGLKNTASFTTGTGPRVRLTDNPRCVIGFEAIAHKSKTMTTATYIDGHAATVKPVMFWWNNGVYSNALEGMAVP